MRSLVFDSFASELEKISSTSMKNRYLKNLGYGVLGGALGGSAATGFQTPQEGQTRVRNALIGAGKGAVSGWSAASLLSPDLQHTLNYNASPAFLAGALMALGGLLTEPKTRALQEQTNRLRTEGAGYTRKANKALKQHLTDTLLKESAYESPLNWYAQMKNTADEKLRTYTPEQTIRFNEKDKELVRTMMEQTSDPPEFDATPFSSRFRQGARRAGQKAWDTGQAAKRVVGNGLRNLVRGGIAPAVAIGAGTGALTGGDSKTPGALMGAGLSLPLAALGAEVGLRIADIKGPDFRRKYLLRGALAGAVAGGLTGGSLARAKSSVNNELQKSRDRAQESRDQKKERYESVMSRLRS